MTKLGHAEGDYGLGKTIRTDYQPAEIALATGSWSFKTQTAFIHSAEEFADIRIGATYAFPFEMTEPFELLAGLTAKLPTAKERPNFSSGAPDYTPRIEIAYIAGAFVPFFELGLEMLGDGAGEVLDDVPYTVAGLSWDASERLGFEVNHEWAKAPVPGAPDYEAMGALAAFKLTARTKLTVEASFGLTDAAPNWNTSLKLNFRLPIAKAKKTTSPDEPPPAVYAVRGYLRDSGGSAERRFVAPLVRPNPGP